MITTTGKKLRIPNGHGGTLEVDYARYFTYRKLTYLWHTTENKFMTIQDLEANVLFIIFILRHFITSFSDICGSFSSSFSRRQWS